jgi:hypothetical protein
MLSNFDTAPLGNFDDEQLEVTNPAVIAGFIKITILIALC